MTAAVSILRSARVEAVLVGATRPEGLPLDLFSTDEARWLGVQANLPGEEEQPRVLLVSVPYALKAADAETLGGKPASACVLADPSPDSNPSRDRLPSVASAKDGKRAGTTGEAQRHGGNMETGEKQVPRLAAREELGNPGPILRPLTRAGRGLMPPFGGSAD